MRQTAQRLWRAARASAARDLLDSARALAFELRLAALHRRSMARAKALSAPVRINFGSGADLRVGWVNIDLSPVADLQLDARRPLPFGDGTATFIYSEHFLEHLEFDDACAFLAESHRVLAPGGRFSVSVPDGGAPVREYANGGGPLLAHAIEAGWHEGAISRMDQLNRLFRQGGQHRYAWDAETLGLCLRRAGFSEVHEREFDPNLDSEKRRIGSLLMEATR